MQRTMDAYPTYNTRYVPQAPSPARSFIIMHDLRSRLTIPFSCHDMTGHHRWVDLGTCPRLWGGKWERNQHSFDDEHDYEHRKEVICTCTWAHSSRSCVGACVGNRRATPRWLCVQNLLEYYRWQCCSAAHHARTVWEGCWRYSKIVFTTKDGVLPGDGRPRPGVREVRAQYRN